MFVHTTFLVWFTVHATTQTEMCKPFPEILKVTEVRKIYTSLFLESFMYILIRSIYPHRFSVNILC